MASVDNRIVRMEFDNAAFERKVHTTIDSLGQLDKALKMEGAKKGLTDVSAAADKMHFGGISDAISGLSAKFMALSTIAITALANITSKAVDAGLRIAKSLTLDQVISGFHEYETNMNSIQTILANTEAKGTTLKDVTASLDELNTYADKTIYSFSDMTKNIGLFTNAGIGLEDATSMIKGFSNAAAASGTSAEGAAGAAYQLSQALSSGTVRLMDWKSLTNVGMGNKNMQNGLIEIADAMGTLEKSGISASEVQDNFNASLEKNWLSADVMSSYLQIMAGDMDEAKMASMGLTKEQIAGFKRQQKTAEDAATKVRTFTALMSTTKEQIGSGWAETFKIVLGDFESATKLFTGISQSIGKMVSASAKRRNDLLKGWAAFGGREDVISGLKSSFQAFGTIIDAVKKSFQDFFPPATVKGLLNMSDAFEKFGASFKKFASANAEKITNTFKIFFGVLKVGWEILKQGIGFFKDLFMAITGFGGGGGNLLDITSSIGLFVEKIADMLTKGGGIKKFFGILRNAVLLPIDAIKSLTSWLGKMFSGDKAGAAASKAGSSFGRLGDRLQSLKDAFKGFGNIWGPFSNAMSKVGKILDKTWDVISDFFSSLGKKIADVMGSGNFDAVLDALNVGLLGGIAALLGKWMKGGLNVNVSMFDSVGKSFDALTDTLKAMQTQVKAKALLKIAEAIAVLTASVVVLSLIDSSALTKSLAAMAAGFTELVAAFATMDKIGGTKGAGKMNVMATGMILLGSAVLVMSGALKILSTMKPEELAVGLAAMAGILGAMTVAAKTLGRDVKGLFAAGAGMIAMALAMSIMAGAVKLFAMMNLGDIAQGIVSISIALLLIGTSMNLFPKNMVATGVGLIAVAVALTILAKAVKSFGDMKWGEMAKGFVGIAGGLIIIAVAMRLMPKDMMATAAGLLIVSVALNIIAKAMSKFGGMSWGEIGKGLLVLAGSLLILTVAMKAMQGSIVGALAMIVVSGALVLLAGALATIAAIPMGNIMKALLGVALALTVFIVAGYAAEGAAVGLLALGAAMLMIGGAFVLFGAGAYMAAKAFAIFASIGQKGAAAITAVLESIGAAIPSIVKGFAEGIVELGKVFINATPVLLKLLTVLVDTILKVLINAVPKLGQLISKLLDEIIRIIGTYIPKIIQLGIDLIMSFLNAIRDNIGEVVNVVADIVTNFIDALTEKVPEVANSLYNFIVTVVDQVVQKSAALAVRLSPVGMLFSSGLLDGVKKKAVDIAKWFGELAGKIIGWIGNVSRTLFTKGVNLISGLFEGVNNRTRGVRTWFANLARSIFGWIGDTGRTLVSRGTGLISGLWSGISNRISSVASWFRNLARTIVGWVGDMGRTLTSKGSQLIGSLLTGITSGWGAISSWLGGIPHKVASSVGDMGRILYDAGRSIMTGLLDGIKSAWESTKNFLGGLGSKIKSLKGPPDYDAIMLYENGTLIMQGLLNGMKSGWSDAAGWLSNLDPSEHVDTNAISNKIQTALQRAVDSVEGMTDLSPVITPVLDLTEFKTEAQKLNDYIQSANKIVVTVSTNQARTIAAGAPGQQNPAQTETQTPSDVKFEQNIYAPKQLSTSDIYRQTRNQITMAKEELSIR